MKDFNLDQHSDELIEKLITPLTDILKNVKDSRDEKKRLCENSIAAYKKDLDERKSAVQNKVGNVKAELEACDEKTKRAMDKLSVALCERDAAAEAAVNEEIAAIAAEEYILIRKYEALSKVELPGRDDLYESVLKAFEDYLDSVERTYEQACAVERVMGVLIPLFEDIRKSARSIDQLPSRIVTRQVWPVVESFNGNVDFRGSKAGVEEDCRIRYVEALVRKKLDGGFENAPAGERLRQDIKKRLIISAQAEKSKQFS